MLTTHGKRHGRRRQSAPCASWRLCFRCSALTWRCRRITLVPPNGCGWMQFRLRDNTKLPKLMPPPFPPVTLSPYESITGNMWKNSSPCPEETRSDACLAHLFTLPGVSRFLFRGPRCHSVPGQGVPLARSSHRPSNDASRADTRCLNSKRSHISQCCRAW